LAYPDDLLSQAKHLARREPKRPRQASLRRAVSSAYFALFHLLTEAASRALMPSRPQALRDQARRAFTHGDMKNVCRQFQSGRVANLSPTLRALIQDPLEPEFAIVATAFIELQDARHAADYDLSAPHTRIDVLEKIDLVEQAFRAWRRVRNEPNANIFLVALLLNRSWVRARGTDNA
jgi:hypothetical protein